MFLWMMIKGIIKKYLTEMLKKASNHWVLFFIGIALFEQVKDKVKRYANVKDDDFLEKDFNQYK